MSKEYFKSHILLSEVRELAGQLWRTLTPLMSSNNQSIGSASSQNPSPSEHDHPSEYFHEGFNRALTLKAGLLLSRRRYKLVFFKPGDKFNADTMTRDGEYNPFARWKPPKRAETEMAIKLCLFPALYSGPEDRQHSTGVNARECVVKYHNFIPDKTDAQGLDYVVVKAVVLV